MPTLADLLTYMGYDVTDDEIVNKNAERSLATAKQLVYGGVGKDVETYLPNDSRVTELVLIYADDLFSQRGLSAKVSNATRLLVHDTVQQLQLELRDAREAAATEEGAE